MSKEDIASAITPADLAAMAERAAQVERFASGGFVPTLPQSRQLAADVLRLLDGREQR